MIHKLQKLFPEYEIKELYNEMDINECHLYQLCNNKDKISTELYINVIPSNEIIFSVVITHPYLLSYEVPKYSSERDKYTLEDLSKYIETYKNILEMIDNLYDIELKKLNI